MTTIGVDVGGTKIGGVRLGDEGLAESNEVPKPNEEVVEAVAALIDSLRAPDTTAVGLGMAGLVRWPEGVFVWGPHVPGVDLPLKADLTARLELPVVVDNDANLAALAEVRMGAAQGFRHVVMLTLGTGIGCGLIFGGAIYRGHSFAGEAGHMTMLPDGPLCACGRRGCWETLVSGSSLDDAARRLGLASTAGRPPGGAELVAAALAGDSAALAVVTEAGHWLGRGISNIVALLDPEVVVIGGAVSAAGDLLLDPARTSIASALEGAEHRPPVEVVPAGLGPRAGAIGAALLAQEVAT
jgi:glucokinase